MVLQERLAEQDQPPHRKTHDLVIPPKQQKTRASSTTAVYYTNGYTGTPEFA